VSGHQQLDVHGSNVRYTPSHSEHRGQAPLKPNHTGFIFIDDETAKKYGGKISFRAKLENTISDGFFCIKKYRKFRYVCFTIRIFKLTSNLRFYLDNYSCFHIEPIPVVLLVVEGGSNTFRTGNTKCYLFICFIFLSFYSS